MSLVLFFDGECGFCQKSVRFVYDYDERGVFEFAPLQGELAGKYGLKGYAEKEGGSMVILNEQDGTVFTKSDAVVELGKALGGVFWVLAGLLSLVPKCLRNGAYDLVAKYRLKLAGSCELPDEGLLRRIRK